jgi:hypothetical protein
MYGEIDYEEESFNIISSCNSVLKKLGFLFIEAVYQEVNAIKFTWHK